MLNTHKKIVFTTCLHNCCPARLQTPYPLNAIPIPTTPLVTDAIKDTLVCVLKSTRFIKVVLCIIANALMTIITDITLIKGINSGSRKKELTHGAQRYMSTTMRKLNTRLNINVVS